MRPLLAEIRKPLIFQAFSQIIQYGLSSFRTNKKVFWIHLSFGETYTFSAIFLNRSVLFLASCSFDIPNALTNTDT